MKKIVLSAFVSFFLLMMTITYPSRVLTWSNGGYSGDPSNPDYGTHDWIAEHALDWLPGKEKRYIVNNLAAYLYGTELPDNGEAPDGIGDTTKHHIYYWSNESLQDDASAVRAYEEYNNTLSLLKLGDRANASKTAGIMSHYIVDVAVFGHVMGAATDWGAEEHHSDYETYVNQRTSSYEAEFNVYLSFDGELDLASAYDAAKELAYDTTFDVDGDLTCVWMDQNYNWSDAVFKDRCGESLNLAVNYLTDVLHTLYLEAASVHNIDTGMDYLTIQGAINAPETLDGHTILVDAGIYYENVVVNKTVTLLGESREDTVIDGGGIGTVVNIAVDNVAITNLTILNSSEQNGFSGIGIFNGKNITVENNNVMNNNVGILIAYSKDIKAKLNMISNNYGGIIVNYSENCTIIENHVSDNSWGISLYSSRNCDLQGNAMTDNLYNLCVNGETIVDFANYISSSNTVNGKQVYYLVNESDLEISPSTYPNLGYLALINSTSIVIKNLNVTQNFSGVLLVNTNNSRISSIYATRNYGGIVVAFSFNVTVEASTALGNTESGIYLGYSENCTIVLNTVTSHTLQKWSNGIELYHSRNNKVTANNILDNKYGIMLWGSSNNRISGNNITANQFGVWFYASNNNIFHHNNFVSNTEQVYTIYYVNVWDDGFEGNYWSNYIGVDLDPLDGIGDTPHIIDGNNQDNYPLIGVFSDFNITWQEETYHVNITSNSTLSNFNFGELVNLETGESWKAIYFQVRGPDNTIGFCRTCIPTALMNATYKVFVNGTEVPHTLLPCVNSANTYLYFTYNHSTQEVIIIPEFPTWASMLLILIVLTFAIVVYCARGSQAIIKRLADGTRENKQN